MRPDYLRLREPVPMCSDPLLDAVIARLRREEMPDLGSALPTGKFNRKEADPTGSIIWAHLGVSLRTTSHSEVHSIDRIWP